MIKDNLFDTPDRIKSNLAILESGMGSAFWKLMCDILDVNIEVVKERLMEGSDDDTIEYIALLRNRLKIYQRFRTTPEDLLTKYASTNTEQPTFDPYETVDDLRKTRQHLLDK